MFYLRELLNGYPSMEIYVRRPSLYPVRRQFLLKSVKNEASCPIFLKEGRGRAQVGRCPGVFCKLGEKDGLGTYTLHHHCKRTWTWWIPDRCCAGLFALFLHDLWRSNIMNVKNEWWTPYMINLVNGDTHWGRRFEGNICRQHRIVHLLALLRPNEQYQQISLSSYLRKKLLFYIWGNKTISRSLTLNFVVFLALGFMHLCFVWCTWCT